MLDVDILQLIIIETQDVPWKHHNCMSIYWGFFVVNNGLFVDLVKLQMLQCIIYIFNQTFL
jgi:hypothetical protein